MAKRVYASAATVRSLRAVWINQPLSSGQSRISSRCTSFEVQGIADGRARGAWCARALTRLPNNQRESRRRGRRALKPGPVTASPFDTSSSSSFSKRFGSSGEEETFAARRASSAADPNAKSVTACACYSTGWVNSTRCTHCATDSESARAGRAPPSAIQANPAER